MELKKIKKRIFGILGIAKSRDAASRIFDIFIVTLVLINVLVLILETYELPNDVKDILYNVEMFSVIIFTIEYFLRIWTAEFLYHDCSKFIAKLKYMTSLSGIVDLLSIIPIFIPNVLPKGMVVIRSCRTFRILKLFDVNRRFNALTVVLRVIKNKFSQLMSMVYIISMLMLTSSILMYNAEHAAQPDVFQNAFSGLWWTVSTIATIGYGDIYPITITGKVLGIIITILGVTIVALPTAILTAGFIEEAKGEKDKISYCPHCGKKLK